MLKFFRKKEQSPLWELKTQGVIWRFLFSAQTHIIIEERVKEAKQTRFLCADIRNGLPVWRDFTLEEKWFTGLENVRNGKVFLHGYANPNLPEHLGIYTLSLETGDLLWYEPSMAFYLATDEFLIAYSQESQDRTYWQLDHDTGKRKSDQPMLPGEAESLRDQSSENEGFEDVKWTDKLIEGDPLFFDMASLVSKFEPNLDPSPGLDVLDLGSTVIFGYHHRKKQNQLCYSMAVVDSKSAEVKLSILLGDDLNGFAGDLFLWKGGLLLAVKGKNTLVCYQVK
ncbi:MAG: DUF4905 domain-containing protein [Bacteroidetes bacterium]|nr:DUF4905 domain-containing protein [Bacteroidota bacterium]